MPRLVPLALAAAVLLTTTGGADAAPRVTPKPTVVVAVADTGINPYHAAFYRPHLTQHPCTYVAGFRCNDIRELPLSIGKYKTYDEAVKADMDMWLSLKPHQWYWIPKTNIVGAVCDESLSVSTAIDEATCILDDNGHGTGTASSVISEAPDALLLVHDGNSGAYDLATMPVTADVQSHSWGPAAPLPLHASNAAIPGSMDDCGPVRRKESVFFIAAGNEAPWPTVLDCNRHPLDVNVVGGGYPGYWTPQSWSMYDFASWFCRPAAAYDDLKATENHCGTSFSAPTAAGAAAAALLTLRRQDGYTGRSTRTSVSRTVTRAAFDKALRDAATYTPKKKFPFNENCAPGGPCVGGALSAAGYPLPEQAPWMFYGYGWLDSTVTPAVVACARRKTCPPKPAAAQQWHDTRNGVRTVFDQGLVQPGPQQDGGTKRDAGETRASAVPIVPGRAYTGTVEPYGLGGDQEDWYTFRAVAGQTISVTGTSYLHPAADAADISDAVGCWWLVGVDGRSMVSGPPVVPLYDIECESAGVNDPPANIRVPRTGTYALAYSAHNGLPKHDYRFTVTLGR